MLTYIQDIFVQFHVTPIITVLDALTKEKQLKKKEYKTIRMRDIFQLFTMLAIHQASYVHRLLWFVCLLTLNTEKLK